MGQAALAPPAGYSARAPRIRDAPAVAELLRATERQDFGEAEAEAAELAGDWETFDLERDAVLVCGADRRIAGYGYFYRRGDRQAIVDVYVHPEDSGRGIATYLLDVLEARAGDVERVGSGIAATNGAARALLEQRGYRFVRRFWRMTIELDRHPPAPSWPRGIFPTRCMPADEHAVWDAIEEAFHDHWEYRPEPYDEWRRRTVEHPGYDSTLCIVGKEGTTVAGVALCRVHARFARIETLAVRRSWRRRGLGRGLVLEAFGEFFRRGEHTVIVTVDSENLTGATLLYEQVGMRVTREVDAYEKVIVRRRLDGGDPVAEVPALPAPEREQ